MQETTLVRKLLRWLQISGGMVLPDQGSRPRGPQEGTGEQLSWWERTCAACVLSAMAAITANAQTLTTLHSFDAKDGSNPLAGLVQGIDGNLYGTTSAGGPVNAGTLFSITPSGNWSRLYNFCSQSGCTDGSYPTAGLIQATNGNFYGTTLSGGANNSCPPYGGCGTVFKITPSGTLTTLYSFCSQSGCTDGENPEAALVQATDGNFYGTTERGGANFAGTVFRITPSGALTTLYSFCSQSNCTDGANPQAGLIQATNGDLYGTTEFGEVGVGSCTQQFGCGTVFKITPSGTLTTLHSFDSTDGSNPYDALVQAIDGNFYGTTLYGGANGDGTVFKITPSGILTTLYSFCSQSGCTDGFYPGAALVQDTNGNFYGTTELGGKYSFFGGTVFKITPGGTLTTLYTFCSETNCTDGEVLYAGLVQDTNGNLYGTTDGGGTGRQCAQGCGTIFSLAVGLGPFVETEPTAGKVGETVKILGTDLTGATSVSFNGTAATFTVVSRSLITTTVPAGATTGKVEVTIPSGTLTSNVPFRVGQ